MINLHAIAFFLAAATFAFGFSVSGAMPRDNKPDALRMITRSGSRLMDGTTPFRFASFNIPNLHFIEDAPQGYFGSFNKRGPPDDFEITDALRTIAQIGGRVTRIYAFAYVNHSDPNSYDGHFAWIPGSISEATMSFPPRIVKMDRWERIPGTDDLYANRELFRAFDLMLTRANEFQIRIIIPFIDKWPFWGGVPEFSKWIGNKTADAFWTDTAVKNNFKSIIRYILERNNSISGVLYRDDPAILMWELGNELALKEGGRIPTEWTIEMAEYVKSVDSNHLVKDGSNTGAFGHQLEVLQHPSIDVIGSHYYHIPRPQDPTYIPPYPLDDSFASRSWVDSAFVTSFDKVFIVDEYGLESLDWTRELLKASVKNSKITGTLLWSLRFHSREGGFYTHDETPTQRAYHYPGFPFNETFNTRDEVEVIQTVKLHALLMHDVSVLEALSITPFITEAPTPEPVILSVNSSGIIWRGSTGAESYTIEYADSENGPFNVLSDNTTDAVPPGKIMYVMPSMNSGWIRVRARNAVGVSKPSLPYKI